MKQFFIFLFLIIQGIDAQAQYTISGTITDKASGEPLPYATIYLKYPLQTSITNDAGFFEMVIPSAADSLQLTTGLLQFIMDGYAPLEMEISLEKSQVLNIKMEEDVTTLDDFVFKAKKTKYRNKDNPAVTLIRNVIDNRDKNRMSSAGYAQMKTYEKINFGSSNMPRFITRNPILKPFRFVFDNVDTARYKGAKTVILFLDETWSDAYIRKAPAASKKIVYQQKRVSLDPKFINEEGTVSMLKHLYQDVDVYDNHFLLVTNTFKSPIASDGPTYYKYFITDTIITDSLRYVHLDFVPRNKVDLLLEGKITIAIDEDFAVKDIYMQITKHTNLNFVSNLSVKMKFEKNVAQQYYLSFMENDVQMVTPFSRKERVVGTRTVVNTAFESKASLPDSLFNQPLVEEQEKYTALSDQTYSQMRPIAFTPQEYKTYGNLDSMKRMPYFHRLVQGINILSTGYKNMGLVEVGNFYRLYSYNASEGSRLRVDLRTNPVVAKRFQANGYLAYGTRDKTFKYLVDFTYSIPNQRVYDFPMQYFRLTAQYDAKLPGRLMETNVSDLLTDNIQRGVNDKFMYVQTLKAEYVHEFPHNLLLSLSGTYLQQAAKGSMYFVRPNGSELDTLSHITSNSVGLQLRWAPGEKFFNNRVSRKRQYNNMPVFLLRGDLGFKDLLNSDYQFQKLTFQLEKRFYMGSFGNIDFNLKANYIWGELPYAFLNIPRANQSYNYSTQSYNLMNNGEFVTDKQVELNLNYRMFGFVLNKVPYLKYLKLREVMGFKMVYGGLSAINDPMRNPSAMQFPKDINGISYIHTFKENVPYMEWNVGVENIFKVLRVDYVRRVNYLDHPMASRHRIQFAIIIDF